MRKIQNRHAQNRDMHETNNKTYAKQKKRRTRNKKQ